jgi:RNA polymerase sigma-70 factor (ECF subfamily)
MDQGAQEQLQAIKAGDERAFEALFKAHYAPLLAFARKFVADAETAEEIVQDLFFALWEKRDALMPTVSLRSYLFAAVRNACLNHLKHLKVRAQHQAHALALPTNFATDPAEDLQAAELEARISLAIAELPDRCGEIFLLSRVEGLKYQEIADQLKLSPRTVEVQIGKALKLLRTQLKPYLPLMFALGILEKWM